jgi:putative (di)nucleoside polyphosphate hydrolase
MIQKSCGILVMNERRELFMAHVTGTRHWHMPKGLKEDWETPLAAALRETEEETGVQLHSAALQDLGEMPYMSKKRLHLFAVVVPASTLDLSACICVSTFKHWRTGEDLPEADAFAWVPFYAVQARCASRMGKLLIEDGVLLQGFSRASE